MAKKKSSGVSRQERDKQSLQKRSNRGSPDASSTTSHPEIEIPEGASLQMSATFVGPLPPPEVLERYGQVSPAIVEHIVVSARAEAEHRHQVDRDLIELNRYIARSETWNRRIGIITGLLVVVCGFSLTGYLSTVGDTVTAGIVGGTSLVGLTSLFVVGRYYDNKERATHDKQPD